MDGRQRMLEAVPWKVTIRGVSGTSGAGVGSEVGPAMEAPLELLALLALESAEQLAGQIGLLHSKVLSVDLKSRVVKLVVSKFILVKKANILCIEKLDVDPRRDDDASPMSSYRCMLRPT